MKRYDRLYIGSGSAQASNGRMEYSSFLVRADNARAAEGYTLAAAQRRWPKVNGWRNHTTEHPAHLEDMLKIIEGQERTAGFIAGLG